MTSVFGLAALAGLVLGGALAQRQMRRERAERLSVVIGLLGIELAAGIVAMALTPSPGLVIAAAVVLAVSYRGFLPADQTMVALVSPRRLRAQAVGWSLPSYGLGERLRSAAMV